MVMMVVTMRHKTDDDNVAHVMVGGGMYL